MAASVEQVRATAGLFDLGAHGKVVVSGPDAAYFLHNVSTNDIKALPVGRGCPAFLATAKAKFVASVLIFHARENEFWVDSAPGTGAQILQHLDRFLISEQAELVNRSDDLAQLHLAGPQAASILDNVVKAPPLEPWQQVDVDGVTVRRLDRFALPGYDILVPRGQDESLIASLQAAGAAPVADDAAEVLRIEAGVPRAGVDMDENNLVMELGGAAEAISFNKGCYLGQEPIVRARDLGHVNWAFRGLKIQGDQPVPIGSKLWRDDKEVGRVTSATRSPGLGSIALGYLRRGSHEPGTAVAVDTGAGRVSAVVCVLPFSS